MPPSPGSSLLVVLAVALAGAAVLARGALAPADDTAPWPPLAGERAWSLLAVGDLGAEPWPIGRAHQVSQRVARALTAEDLRAPADALVLLGDNFYPDGLRREELETRVRANLAEPLCRFLPAPDVRCAVAGGSARVLAVLGNHDHKTPESPALQRREIARRLPAWEMPAEAVATVALGHGVSLVLYDGKELLDAGSFAPLQEALRASPGPWRIAASHYPLTRREQDRAGRAARAVFESLDVPVHLHLAGHRHYLELAHTATPPFLQAIAGSGSNTRPRKAPVDGSILQLEQPGFVRADLVAGSDGERLVVSLVALPEGLVVGGRRPRVAARWSVGLKGDARAEPLPGD